MNQNHSFNRLIGAILMIAGCCIGAGMLGIPLVTLSAGFIPSVAAFVISWLFMASTGLLLLEVNLWFGTNVNLMTLTEGTLGKKAKWLVAFLFLFLFYCLMMAFLSAGGALVAELSSAIIGTSISPGWGNGILAVVFGSVIFMGSRQVDLVNRVMMLGLAICYITLVSLGFSHVEQRNLESTHWLAVFPAFPAMAISFGYHNLVPSLTEYLKGHVRYLKIAIVVGSALPLAIYLLWDGLILGILPQTEEIALAVQSGDMVTTLLRRTIGSSYVADIVEYFAFFALVTTFITVGLSFVDFLADGLKIKKTPVGSLWLVLMVLLPPLFFSYYHPNLFLMALNYAGAFGTVILFGIIPVMMVWKGRYYEKKIGPRLLPGGKLSLVLIFAFAAFVFAMQLWSEILGAL